MTAISWDECFMSMAFLAAMKSKDERTQIGAVIVDKKHRLVSQGFNGLPMDVNDNVPERQIRPEKYFWFEHAERNAIYNAKRDLEGCIMYTNGVPCADCARACIQAGIKEIVVHKQWNLENINGDWNRSCTVGQQMLEEAGIKIREYNGKIVNIKCLRAGEPFTLK